MLNLEPLNPSLSSLFIERPKPSMMKLIYPKPWRLTRDFLKLYCTESRSASISSPGGRGSLFQRVLDCRDKKASIIPLLDQWIEEGRQVKRPEIHGIVKVLRKHRRFSHALQVQEWMTKEMDPDLSSEGISTKLELISYVHGLDKAEEYFNSLPVSSRDYTVHGALLNCYAEKKLPEKAEEHFQKMKESGLAESSAFAYNVQLNMYSQMGAHEKFSTLLEEMEKKGIKGDDYTYVIQLDSYANSSVDKMEKLLIELEGDSNVTENFQWYLIAAKGYLKEGFSEKALKAVTKAEELVQSSGLKFDHKRFISMYGEMGRKDDIHRVWDMFRAERAVINTTDYLRVLNWLWKNKDVEGAEKVFTDWEINSTSFESQIAYSLINGYCKNGLVEKAFERVEGFLSQGHEIEAGIWNCLAYQCCVEGKMGKAVETLKKATLGGGPRWKLNRYVLDECLKYLKKEGDSDVARELLGLIRERGALSESVCNELNELVNRDRAHGAMARIGLVDN